MPTSSPLTILMIDQGEGMGGAELCLLELARAIDHRRFRPVVACGSGPLEHALRAEQIETRHVDLPQLRGYPARLPSLLGASRTLALLARREGASVLHCNTARAGAPTLLAALWSGRPWLWHAHEMFG